MKKYYLVLLIGFITTIIFANYLSAFERTNLFTQNSNDNKISDLDCAVINDIIKYASSNFIELKGEIVDNMDGCKYYQTKVKYGNKSDLQICNDEDIYTLSIKIYSGKSESEAKIEFNKWSKQLDNCLIGYQKTIKESGVNILTTKTKYSNGKLNFSLNKNVDSRGGIKLSLSVFKN